MNRTFVASDIHGHGHMLEGLLAQASFSPSRDRLYLLGDYVNKGPDSLGTLRLVRRLQEQGAVALRGNHEQKLLGRVDSPCSASITESWLMFLESLPLWREDSRYIYVHAGIRPGVPMDRQSPDDLTGIRGEFHGQATGMDKIVIFGHTSTHVLGAKPGEVWRQPDKIGIDTGAAHKLKLSLVDLTSNVVYASEVS